jgi:2-methylaconitate cis-trans-isomerase PrpF
MQIDDMGGTHTHTPKIAIVDRSEREDADVDFTFVQVGVGENWVGYGGSCRNTSSSVGCYRIYEGLLKEWGDRGEWERKRHCG